MKIVQINTFPYKATGAIMLGIHQLLIKDENESVVVWGRGRDSENDSEIVIKDELGVKIHGLYTRLTDKTGFASKHATRKLIAQLEIIKPDIIHLHNIHGYYLNIEMLFEFIKTYDIKVVWTLHDCCTIISHILLVAPITFVGLTALSVDTIMKRSASYFSQSSTRFCVPNTLL